MIRRSLTLVGAALAAFHVWLFAGQVWSGALGDPGLILRWLVAAGLIGALVSLKRRGESVFLSRKSIAIWVLAALLHGPALAARVEAPGAPPIPDVVITLTQTMAGLIGLVGLGLLLAGVSARHRPAFIAIGCLSAAEVPAPFAAAGPAYSPRPPPAHKG